MAGHGYSRKRRLWLHGTRHTVHAPCSAVSRRWSACDVGAARARFGRTDASAVDGEVPLPSVLFVWAARVGDLRVAAPRGGAQVRARRGGSRRGGVGVARAGAAGRGGASGGGAGPVRVGGGVVARPVVGAVEPRQLLERGDCGARDEPRASHECFSEQSRKLGGSSPECFRDSVDAARLARLVDGDDDTALLLPLPFFLVGATLASRTYNRVKPH